MEVAHFPPSTLHMSVYDVDEREHTLQLEICGCETLIHLLFFLFKVCNMMI